MHVVRRDIMTDDEGDLKEPSGWAAIERGDLLVCAIPGLVILLIVTYFSDLGRGRAAGVCTMIDVLVMKLRWESRPKLGLWSAMLLILLAQTAVIVRVPFGDQWISAYALLPVGLMIYVVEESIVFLFTRKFRSGSSSL
jgi:hypothetical protein